MNIVIRTKDNHNFMFNKIVNRFVRWKSWHQVVKHDAIPTLWVVAHITETLE